MVTTDHKNGEVLMLGFMNSEALKKTISTKEAHYWSRSKNAIWHKGKTSGFIQKVIELKIDDDQDSIWMSVDIGDGASCHVGYRSCFYRSIPLEVSETSSSLENKIYRKRKKKNLTPKKFTKINLIPLNFKMSKNQKNVYGEPLEGCSENPKTGWFRDGCCNTDNNDVGYHTVCAKVTKSF